MRELVTNPLLLTILCIVYHEERNLPTARAELYQHCVRVLLGLWPVLPSSDYFYGGFKLGRWLNSKRRAALQWSSPMAA